MRTHRHRLLLIVLFGSTVVLAGVLCGCGQEPAQPLKLGAVFPLTGDVASYGNAARNGIELAVDEFNAAGGIDGRSIEVDFQDDKGESKTAVSVVKRFTSVNDYPVIFGSAGSSVTLAIAPIANRNEVVLVSPVSSSAKLSSEGGPYFFRTCPADDVQAEVLAKWVSEDGHKRVAVVYTNNSWGQPLAEGFTSRSENSGGVVVLSEGVPENTTDFRTLITKIKRDDTIDAVVSPTYPKEGGTFVRQCQELGLSLPLYGGDNWGSPEFREVAGAAANGVLYTAQTEGQSPRYPEFAEAFQAKFGKEPDVFAAYAYDAATVVFRAMESAESMSGKEIRDALATVSTQGVSGPIKFRPNGDIDSEAFARMTIRDGKPEQLG